MRTTCTLALFAFLTLTACSKPSEGKQCDHSGEAVCADPKTMLHCTAAKWTKIECGGANGCSETADKVDCDATRSRVGTACVTPTDMACSTDGKAMLKCTDFKWQKDSDCAKCLVNGDDIECQTD